MNVAVGEPLSEPEFVPLLFFFYPLLSHVFGFETFFACCCFGPIL